MTQSKVGNASLYEAGDQRNAPNSEKDTGRVPDSALDNSHIANDSKDERSIKNRLAEAEPQNDDESGKNKTNEQVAGEIDPTAPARMHGNEPSRGAVVDAQIMMDEEEELRKKDEAKKQSKEAKKH